MRRKRLFGFFTVLLSIVCLSGCGNVPIKKFYIINYEPEPLKTRAYENPYPYTIRVKEFDIEEAYARPQIVYRKSPFQLQYYFFKVWAVKPIRMITDIVHKHLASSRIVSHVVKRFDEGARPDYELSGHIEAIEEYYICAVLIVVNRYFSMIRNMLFESFLKSWTLS
jgi:ABC-type uncharacterized transport system auxiliary subunit